MIGGGDRLALRERGMVADTGTAALVAADGTVDWWCPGGFAGDAAFYRLLDPAGGALRVAPVGLPPAVAGRQSYRPGTLVLRTELATADAAVAVLDFLPWRGAAPDGRLIRLVRGLRGQAEVGVDVVPAARWRPARQVDTWSEGIAFDGLRVHTGCAMDRREGRFRLAPGEEHVVVAEQEGEVPRPVSVADAHDLLERTEAAWRMAVAPLGYVGPYRDAVERSVLVLRSLTTPWGSVVGAPTTSLPLDEGGERNWDARFAWVLTNALAVGVLQRAGVVEHADLVAGWLRGVLRDLSPPLPPVLALDSSAVEAGEDELAVHGWRRSQPVRVGTEVPAQRHLDLWADVAAALTDDAVLAATSMDAVPWPAIEAHVGWLADHWAEPDHGLWEPRTRPRRRAAGTAAAWFALRRMALRGLARNPLDLTAAAWREEAKEAEAWMERELAGGGGRGDMPDAALLRLAWRGPWPPSEPPVARVVDGVLAELGEGAFVHPVPQDADDGLPPGRGPSLAASFWAVRALAELGRWEEAHVRMDELVGFVGPLGLVPAAAHVPTRAFLGNLPDTLAHLALVDAALALTAGPS